MLLIFKIMIKHTYFQTMELLNKWVVECGSKIDIVSISYDNRYPDEVHHVYYRVK